MLKINFSKRSEAFTAAEVDETFSIYQPSQFVKITDVSGLVRGDFIKI
jgi:hypothetical protein